MDEAIHGLTDPLPSFHIASISQKISFSANCSCGITSRGDLVVYAAGERRRSRIVPVGVFSALKPRAELQAEALADPGVLVSEAPNGNSRPTMVPRGSLQADFSGRDRCEGGRVEHRERVCRAPTLDRDDVGTPAFESVGITHAKPAGSRARDAVR